MKRVLKTPPKPTADERKKLDCYFFLPDWQFDSLIESKCAVISSRIIAWKKSKPDYAHIYGLEAVFSDSGKPCFANFFVRRGFFIYQFRDIEQAVQIIELIKKDVAYDEYEQKIWNVRYKERQRKRN